MIRVLDHSINPSSYKDGEVIFALISEMLKQDQQVVVDFSGVTSIPSAFVNSAFIRLLEHFSFDQVKRNLSFTHSTRQINQLIKSRFEFVNNKLESQKLNEADDK